MWRKDGLVVKVEDWAIENLDLIPVLLQTSSVTMGKTLQFPICKTGIVDIPPSHRCGVRIKSFSDFVVLRYYDDEAIQVLKIDG